MAVSRYYLKHLVKFHKEKEIHLPTTFLRLFKKDTTFYHLHLFWIQLSVSFRQIICWYSRGNTTVTEVKLHYFRDYGSTTVVAVKKQV